MGLETLERLRAARNYNRWVYSLCRPHLGRRILELGSGLGSMTAFFLAHGEVLATDVEDARLVSLAAQQGNPRNLRTFRWDATQDPPAGVRSFRPDTVVAVNLLEHLPEDARVLARMVRLTAPGGRIILYVPALPGIYGSLDRELGHVRRYRQRDLLDLARASGLAIERLHYVNAAGTLGWWLNSRVLRRRHFSPRQIRLNDFVVPLLARAEAWLRPPFGMSLFFAGRLPGGETRGSRP